MSNFKFTVMQESDLQKITLVLSFKLFKIFQNFKATFGYFFSDFLCPYLISGQCSLFIPEFISIEEKIGPKNIQVLLFSK